MKIFYLRRIPISPSYIKPDGSISSFAFTLKKGEDGISTDLERLADKDKSVLDKAKFRLAKINAGYIREEINDGLDCVHSPLPENYATVVPSGFSQQELSFKKSLRETPMHS